LFSISGDSLQLKSFKKDLPKELKTSIAKGYLIKFKELRDFAD